MSGDETIVDKNVSKVQKLDSIPNSTGNYKNQEQISALKAQIKELTTQLKANKEMFEEQIHIKTKELERKLYYDNLTNLRNRFALESDIKDEEFVSIILLDIDSFDDINELYGFRIGNSVLIEVSKILKEFAIKHNIEVYRMYGNVYCFADKRIINFFEYSEFIEKVGKLFKNRPIYIKELDIDVFINITLGISLAQEEPIKTAGIALKRAKKNNRQYLAYNNEIDTKDLIEKSIHWREKIKKAIENDSVIPFYQAIFDKNRNIIKYETLMRIKDIDDNGDVVYIAPYLFLDISIKTKQYLQLSSQVISKALNDLTRTDKQISINLSFKDILDIQFMESLDENFEKISNDDKSRIVFEILESDYISDYSLLEEFVIKYKKQGVKIAIDDFGTGYSNFAHILKIRPNYIKIDGSLIKNIDVDKNSYELVKSIIVFCKALNIKTIAEFVHTEDIFDLLLEMGIEEFQGFCLAEPLPNIF